MIQLLLLPALLYAQLRIPKANVPGNSNVHRVIAHGQTITEPKDCIEEEMRKRTLIIHINGLFCSGILMDGNTIAMAGHCGSGAKDAKSRKIEKGPQAGGLAKAFYFDSATNQYKETPRPMAASTQFEGDVATGQISPEQKDMLVMKLSKTIPGIKPLKRTPRKDMKTRVPMDLYVAGFGLTEHNAVSSELKYLWAKGHIKEGESHVTLQPEFEKDRVRKGDSGGPIFRVVGDCEVELAGITKAVDEGSGGTRTAVGDSAEDVEAHVAELNYRLQKGKPSKPSRTEGEWKTTVQKPARK